MQIVIAWVVGSPLLAVLVGKMIALGDRTHVAIPGVASVGPLAEPAAPRFEATSPLLGSAEAAA